MSLSHLKTDKKTTSVFERSPPCCRDTHLVIERQVLLIVTIEVERLYKIEMATFPDSMHRIEYFSRIG